MKNHTNSLRKQVIAAMMGAVLCFGIAFTSLPMTAAAQAPSMTEAEMREEIDRLMLLVQALLAQLAVINGNDDANDVQPIPDTVCPYTWTRSLNIGDEGEDVRRLQQFLNMSSDTRVGDSGEGSPGFESTYYGNATAAAVSRFQVKYRDDILTPVGEVNPTGYFGPTTMGAANVLCQPGTSYTPTPDPVDPEDGMTEEYDDEEVLIIESSQNNPDASTIIISGNSTTIVTPFAFVLDASRSETDVFVDSLGIQATVDANGFVPDIYDATLVVGGQQYEFNNLTITGQGTEEIQMEFDLMNDVYIPAGESVEVYLEVEFNEVDAFAFTGATVQFTAWAGDLKANVEDSGTVRSEEHTLLIAGPLVEVADRDVTVYLDGQGKRYGEFSVELEVQAVGGDVYVARNEFVNDAGEIVVPVEMTSNIGDSNEGQFFFNFDSNADVEDRFYVIDEGDTESILVTASFFPDTSGTFRMNVKELLYTIDDVNGSLHSLLLDDAYVGPIMLDGFVEAEEPYDGDVIEEAVEETPAEETDGDATSEEGNNTVDEEETTSNTSDDSSENTGSASDEGDAEDESYTGEESSDSDNSASNSVETGVSTEDGSASSADSDSVETYYMRHVERVTRRDFYNDEAKTDLAYRNFRIFLNDGTIHRVKRYPGTSRSKFTEQLRETGYGGSLDNFQDRVKRLSPRVLGASISVDPYAQLSNALIALENILTTYKTKLK